MSNVRKPIHPQDQPQTKSSPHWRTPREEAIPCQHRLRITSSMQLVRQKWLVPGKTRWCDYL